MAKMYIMGAGHSFIIGDSAYAKLISFADKVSLLGIKSRISPKTYESTTSLFAQCSYASKSGDYVVIINERQNPNGDVGKAMLCECFNLGLHINEQMTQQLEKDKHKHEQVPPEILEQVPMLPENSILIANPVGIEPGYILDIQDKLFFFLPHQPEELFSMLDECVLPILANLSEMETATANVAISGLEPSAIEARLNKLLKKELAYVYFECSTQGKTVEIILTVFAKGDGAAKSLANRYAELVTEHFWPNIMDKSGGSMANALQKMLQVKKISLAAAVTGKELKKGIASLLPFVFRYLFNADSPVVREMALEVPRAYLHENGGINRREAMYMAHNVTAICEAQAGFALIMEPGTPQAVMAFFIADRVTAQEFTLPDGLNEHEKIDYACRYAMRFCSTALEAYPEDIPDSVPVAEFLADEEGPSSALSLLWPNWRRTGA